jgi:hypothetical protein
MGERAARTLLEHRIRERRMTLDEFVDYAEKFARDHHEPGTLSRRHLQRLTSGTTPGTPRPATARLLERIFGEPITALLAPPRATLPAEVDGPASELRQLLDAARRVDTSTLALLHQQLHAIRRLDRQLGALVVREELTAKIHQVEQLCTHSLAPRTREPLAALLSEMHTLAGWQALDLGDLSGAWRHYHHARAAAAQSGSPPHQAHAATEQAFVLLDAGATADAVDLLDHARHHATHTAPRVLRAWLAAAHGEALAAHNQRSASLHAFDHADRLLPTEDADERPYVALNPTHLARWRGHALARFGHPDAIPVLTHALANLDPTFTRARTALHIDLATAHTATGNHPQARADARKAHSLAQQLGSVRQRRRLLDLMASPRLCRDPGGIQPVRVFTETECLLTLARDDLPQVQEL